MRVVMIVVAQRRDRRFCRGLGDASGLRSAERTEESSPELAFSHVMRRTRATD